MKGKFFGLMGMAIAVLVLAGCETGTTETGTVMGSIVINAPVEKVWDYYCSEDFAKANPNFRSASNQQGERCTVGFSEDQIHKVMGQTYNIKTMTTEVVPNQRIVGKTAGDVDGTSTALFVPEGNGTRLVVISEVTGKLPPGITYDTVRDELYKLQAKELENHKNAMEK